MHPEHITLETLRKARHTVAQLVLMDRIYLPILKRLENEIKERVDEDDLIARARALVNG